MEIATTWDHITIFKIECSTISMNKKLKLQQFSASLSGNAVRWFNNRQPRSISSWDESVEQLIAHSQLMENLVKIEHTAMSKKVE